MQKVIVLASRMFYGFSLSTLAKVICILKCWLRAGADVLIRQSEPVVAKRLRLENDQVSETKETLRWNREKGRKREGEGRKREGRR